MRSVPVRALQRLAAGDHVHVEGWVRSVRKQKNVQFLSLNDGSNLDGVQVVFDSAVERDRYVVNVLLYNATQVSTTH